jgi:hypothetical protein
MENKENDDILIISLYDDYIENHQIKKCLCCNKHNNSDKCICSKCEQNIIKKAKGKRNKCNQIGCKKTAIFNYDCFKFGIRCAEHKDSGMENVKHRKCNEKDCKTIPIFNFPEEAKGIRCAEHKKLGMIDVRHIKCEHDGCETRPIFNYPEEVKGIKCAEHKTIRMIDVEHKKCDFNGCKTIPVFNFPEETKAIRCAEHKKLGMINIISKRCNFNGCEIIPSFNFPEETKGLRCAEHKESGMINVISRRCNYNDCKTQPIFNYPDEVQGIRCDEHKEFGMIDVIHRKCNDEKCNNRAYYGIPGNQSIKCSLHKTLDMIYNPKTICKSEDCKEIALFGITNSLHCEEHKENNEINLVLKNCIICNLPSIVNQKGECGDHDPTLLNRGYLQKQKRVKKLLEEHKIYIYSYDKQIENGICNKRRPDLVIDCGTHFIVIEVDENQHRYHNNECEKIRMLEILQSFGIPVIFIRYNPDKYIMDKFEKELKRKDREKILIECIDKCKKNEPTTEEYLRVIYLFYDNYKIDKTYELQVIDLPEIF